MNNQKKTILVKAIVGTILAITVFFIWAISMRNVAIPFAIILIFLCLGLPFHNRLKLISATFIVFLFLAILPLDIRFDGMPNQQYKILENFVGLPGPEASAKWLKGNIYWSGCISSGYQPKWVLVL
jgi:hypothetical protein